MRHLSLNQKINILSLVLIALSLLLVLWVNIGGVGFTYDSFDYYDAAKDLDQFFGGEAINGRIIRRPPFYPLIVSSFLWMNKSGLILLNMILYGINLFLSFKISNRICEDSHLKWVAVLCISFSATLHLIHVFAWTEPLVLCTVLLQLVLLFDNKTEKNYSLVILLGVISVLTKNGAMLLIPGIALVIFVMGKGSKKWIVPILYLALCWASYDIWNDLIDSPSVSDIVSEKRGISLEYLNVLSVWIMPLKVPVYVRYSAVILLLFFIGFLTLKNAHLFDLQLISLSLFLVSYVLLRSYYSDIYFHEAERYLSIVYPVFIIILLKILSFIKLYQRQILTRIYYGFCVYLVIYSIARAIKNDYQWISDRLFL